MISSTVIVACRGKRWFDLDSVRVPFQGVNAERQADGYQLTAANKHTRSDAIGGPQNDVGHQPYGHPAGAPPLDWHVDGITATPNHQLNEEPMTLRYVVGDTRDVTATIGDGSVDLIFTSPPFLALRSYLPADHAEKHREIGSEANPAAFLDTLLELTAEWGRVLALHGTIAIELGDTYSSGDGSGWPLSKSLAMIPQLYTVALAYGINPLTGQPSPAGRWRVRNVIAWHRPNPPVGALGDKWRPASSYITTACRGGKRWFDLDAVRTEHQHGVDPATMGGNGYGYRAPVEKGNATVSMPGNPAGAPPLNWHTDGDLGTGHIILTTQPYAGSHYATFPMELPRKIIDCMCPRAVCRVCGKARERVTGEARDVDRLGRVGDAPEIKRGEREAKGLPKGVGNVSWSQHREAETLGWSECGCKDNATTSANAVGREHESKYRPGIVLDPFCGTGTTLAAAQDLGRDAIGIDIDEENAWLARERCGMFATFEHHVRPVVDTADL